MKKYALDTSFLPKVWLTWATTKNKEFNKRYWLNCQTEEKKDTPEEWMNYFGEDGAKPKTDWKDDKGVCFGLTYYRIQNGKVWIAANSKMYLTYAKYHADIERLEIAVVKLDTKRNADGQRWQYAGNRFFICKDKSIVNEKGEPIQYKAYIDDDPWHYAYNGRQLLSILLRNSTTKQFVDEFKKFIGAEYFTIGNGTSVQIDSVWHLHKWYETVQKQRSTSKRQKKIDELVAMPLSDCSDLSYRYPEKSYKSKWGYEDKINNILYFERIDDEWSVLRYFYNRVNETWRVYLNDNGKIFIVSKDGRNGWISSKQQKSHWGSYCYFANPDDAIEKCPRIKYILSTMSDIEELHKVDLLITALRFPEIEQLIKFGYPKLAENAALDSYTKAYLKDSFGSYYNDKGTNLLKKIGMTKKQFDICMQDHQKYVLYDMRQIFSGDLSYMDIESFEKYYNAFRDFRGEMRYRSFSALLENITTDKELQIKIFKNLARLKNKDSRIYSIFSDTVNSYIYLNAQHKPEIDWCFDDVSDVTRIHDAIIELKRIQDEEQRALWDMQAAERRKKEDEKRKKVDEERKCYEYEDRDYIIRLPKDCAEIVSEGSVQHICIGGYTSDHSFGYTNLFFLRKKSEPDAPFYAIEMNNEKHIRQIHGFGNRWLGNNPEAIPTVIRWLRKNGIQCTDDILTCTAIGYGKVNNYVPMPVVD